MLEKLINSTTKYERDNLIKAYKVYPKPQLCIGDIFTTHCESSIDSYDRVKYNMKIGDNVLVMGCLPITRFDGSLIGGATCKPEDGPYWCYIFKNLNSGVEFEMQGHPAHIDILPRNEATRALYE